MGTRKRTRSKKTTGIEPKKVDTCKSKLTPEREKGLLKNIQGGVPITTAAALAGISEVTYYAWLKKGECYRKSLTDPKIKAKEDWVRFMHFVDNVRKAEAEAEARMIKLVQTKAKDTWQAAAWYLERRHPKKYSLHNRHEITGAKGGPLLMAVADLKDELSPKALMELAREISNDFSDKDTAMFNESDEE